MFIVKISVFHKGMRFVIPFITKNCSLILNSLTVECITVLDPVASVTPQYSTIKRRSFNRRYSRKSLRIIFISIIFRIQKSPAYIFVNTEYRISNRSYNFTETVVSNIYLYCILLLLPIIINNNRIISLK